MKRLIQKNLLLTNKMKKSLTGILLVGALILLFGCNQKQLKKPSSAGAGPQSTSSSVNMDEVRGMARVFAQEFAAELKRQNVSLPVTATGASGTASNQTTSRKIVIDSAPDVMAFYEENTEGFKIATLADLPKDLKWENGSGLDEFSSPHAKRGGTFMEYMSDFPRTMRLVGPDANGAFRSYMLDYNAIGLVGAHPNGDGYYPGLAKSWAYGAGGKTVYFKLDPEARYSDGESVRAADYFFCLYFMRSKHIQAPWYNDQLGIEKIPNITIYDESTISITYYKAKPDVIEKVGLVRPVPEHFYTELDEQFVEDFQ